MKRNIEQKLDLLQAVDAGNSQTELSDIYDRIKKGIQDRAPVGMIAGVSVLILLVITVNIFVTRRLDNDMQQHSKSANIIPDLVPDHNFYEGGSL